MATRTTAYRDGVVSLLVLAVVAGAWLWWSNRGGDDSPVVGTTATRTTTARPATARPTSAKPEPTTARPTAPKPTPAKPTPTSTRTFTPVRAGTYAVRWVSYGDTFSVNDAKGRQLASVRIIGLNAPEVAHGAAKAECYGPQAAARLKALLAGKRVTLVDDPRAPMFDRYGRRLAYVEVGGKDVATLMIRDGYAVELHLPSAGPSVRTPTYVAAQAQAKAAKRGLWGACRTPPGADRG